MKPRAWRIEVGGWRTRSTLECGDLSPLSAGDSSPSNSPTLGDQSPGTESCDQSQHSKNWRLRLALFCLLPFAFCLHALADPVDAAESDRNELVFALYQHNRNPFVDRPDWVPAAFLPQLLIGRTTNGITLHWPGELVDARVDAAVAFPAGWVQITNAAAVRGTEWNLALPIPFDRCFYRLNLR
jgi:hypothetical protein